MATISHSSHSPGIFSITKARVFLFVSLSITWWLASILPHYRPIIQAGLKSRLDDARQKIPSLKVDRHQSLDDPRNAYNTSKVALMIEPRPLPHLVPQILHMMSVVPPDWRFLFIGSNVSVVSLGRAYATKHQQIIGKLDLMTLPEPWEIDTKEKVFRLLTDMRFYDEFMPGVEWILKYEADSILCANSEDSLNNWLDWHWAGAPRTAKDRFSGNGGLSLRRVSAIRQVLGFQERYNDTEAEDEWFGKRLWVMPGIKVAAGSNGQLAVENVYIENPMGFHVRDGGERLADQVWKDPARRQKILGYCPELSMIMDMKLERERCKGDDQRGTIHPTPEEKKKQEARRKKAERLRKEAEKKKQEEEEARKQEEEARKQEEEARKQEEERRKNAQEEAAKMAVEEAARKSGFAMVNGTVVMPTPASDGTVVMPTPSSEASSKSGFAMLGGTVVIPTPSLEASSSDGTSEVTARR